MTKRSGSLRVNGYVHILLVEDQPINLQVAARMLETLNIGLEIETTIATDGARAVELASQDRFDLILVADVLYDRANLPWLDRLCERAPAVLLGDSRVRDFSHPSFRRLGEWEASTWPDLDESPAFRRVSLYAAGMLD